MPKMTIEIDVTVSQGLALKAMFDYWNELGSFGSSRDVGFHCDGDGNFHPNCKVSFDDDMPELTDEMRKASIVQDNDGDRVYDFDPIAWMLHGTD
jgi:hypothetical protein